MTDYDKQELRDREIIKKYVCENYLHITNPDYIQPTETNNRVDIYFTATTTNNKEVAYVGEIKERKYPLSNPDNKVTYWMLQLDKLEELKKNKEHRPLYINIFSNNIILVWDLNKLDFSNMEKKKMELKKTTLEDTGTKIKHYFDLPSNMATLIKY